MTAAGSRFAHARETPSLLVFDVHVLSVDYAFVFLLTMTVVARRRACAWSRTCPWSACRLRSLIHLLRQLMRGRRQLLSRRIHRWLVAAFDSLLRVRQRVLNIAALGAGDFVAMFFQHLLDVVNHRVELILGLDLFAPRFVFGRMRIGFLSHALDFFLRQARRRRDRDLLILAGGH